MSKYIIEIPDDVQYVLLNGKADGKYYTAVHPIAELEELNSDYINEHYGELQDEAYQKGINDGSLDVKLRVEGAYQKGFDDGKNSIENGCKGCKYEDQHGYDEPCNKCLHAHASHYTPMPKQDDPIKVGDEVEWEGENFTVLRVFTPKGCYEQCDGFDSEGNGYTNILTKDVKKTGRHFDIASILEAMRE